MIDCFGVQITLSEEDEPPVGEPEKKADLNARLAEMYKEMGELCPFGAYILKASTFLVQDPLES